MTLNLIYRVSTFMTIDFLITNPLAHVLTTSVSRTYLQPTFGVMAPETALLFVILSPVSVYYKADSDGAVSMYADPNVVRAFPGGVGNRKVGSNYGPTIGAYRSY